ncbi:MAG: RtcB family protein [Bacteroidales bacterium]|nr:RtcB family protein [Bacteroidales bacterium]
MKTIIQTEGLPIKSWTLDIEEGALEQAKHLAQHPYGKFHVVLLPDVHEGFGMPIGSVFATKDVVVPNAVGVDIGCGMCAVRTSLHKDQVDRKLLQSWVDKIYNNIPVGFKHHKQKQSLPDNLSHPVGPITEREWKEIPYQLGTLGGGNHFIEIQYDKEGYIWIMLHSGSRNLGKQVADHYNKIAKSMNDKLSHPIPSSWNLSALPVDSLEGQQYLKEMQYCLDFARENRFHMMHRIMEIIGEKGCKFDKIINIHHNYASYEEHFKTKVWVHRKGAILADRDTIGIIPGSQGTPSFIVRGKGNPQSFRSSSHGAGRKMSRNKAIQLLDLNGIKSKLDKQGIIHAIKKQKDLDEAPDCYKDIHQVIDEQKDLVEILHILYPLAVIKG